MKKTLKIVAGILLGLVLLVLVVVVALVVLVDPNDYKPQLQALAAKQNVELNIEGELSWSFYPQLGIRSGKFSIKPPIQKITKPFQFDSLVVSVKLLPLLHRQVVVDQVAIHGNEISLHDDTSGSDTIITKLVLVSSGLNLEQRAFPLSLSLQVNTTKPQRQVLFKMQSQVAVDAQIKNISLKQLTLQLDDTQFTGDIQAKLGSKPFLDVNLAGTRLDVDHYSPPAPKQKNNADASRSKTGNKSSDDEPLLPAAAILALPGNYHISFTELVMQHLHLAPFDVVLTISPKGLLTIKKLKAGFYDGELSMHGSVDAGKAQPTVAMDMAVNKLNLAPALRDYYQIDKAYAEGDFSFDTSVTTQGFSYKQLIGALSGNFIFHSQKIILDQVDLTSSLNTSLLQLLQMKLPNLMSGENQTLMTDMAGKGFIERGLINNTSFTALGPCLDMNGAGTYNLVNADVDYYLDITFPSANSDKLCSEINRRLKDIAWPVACQGSLDAGAAEICGANTEEMKSIAAKSLKKEASKELEKNLDKTLKKKFGGDSDAIKKSLKGLF